MNYEIRKIYEANTCRLDEEMSLLSHRHKIRAEDTFIKGVRKDGKGNRRRHRR